jgi:hypothetical protein
MNRMILAAQLALAASFWTLTALMFGLKVLQ